MSQRNFTRSKRAGLMGQTVSMFINGLVLTGLASFVMQDGPEKPDETRFTPVVVAEDLDEPMAFEVLKDGTAFIIERKGTLKKWDPATQTVDLIATLPVNTKYTSAQGKVSEAEEGLLGLSLDPKFEQNHFMYLYYAHPTEKKHLLTRWELRDNKLQSEKVMLEVPTQREVCCHTGGGMTWDRAGNLYLTVGNNTGNQQAAQTDERPDRSSWDDQGHAGNTNDLRGKILRIHPEANGTYTIPDGNLFAKGTPKTRPEIYSMGHRNPWRISIDSQTGYVYWGEIGPDATKDSEIGPRGYDEMNQARKPGNFGWPWFVGNDQAFPVYDYGEKKPLGVKDPKKPMNTSPNNTGLTELPPTAPSFIYYPYAISEEFPLVGTGSRSATGGPVYRQADFKGTPRPWPAYYEGKWLATDFSRGWIMAISMDAEGNYKSMERVLPSYHPVEPIDMDFGPNGDLYVLEYGSNWFRKSDNARLVRIEYNGGNRKPVVQASASKAGGTVPLQLSLLADGTKDFDGDALTYQWKVTSPGAPARVFTTANPSVTFDKAGVYTATLTVKDNKGAANSQSVRIIAGNEPPTVSVNLTSNRTFFFPDQPIQYAVQVSDKEDGSLAKSNAAPGQISPARVAMSIDYTSEGFDYAEVMQSQRSVDASTQYAVAQSLINQSDCKVCHQIATKSVGPAFTAIATKYKGDAGAHDRLVTKIRQGGVGVWGDVAMPGHPAMSTADAGNLVNYILHINEKTYSTLPTQGAYSIKLPQDDNGKGSVLIRAAYTDLGVKGARPVPAQTAEKVLILRSPQLEASAASIIQGADVKAKGMGKGENVIPYHNSYIGFRQFDLTGIKQLELAAQAQRRQGSAGGTIEVRLDSPTGPLIGETTLELEPEVDMTKLMAQMESAAPPAAAAPASGTTAAGAKAATPPPGPGRFSRPPVKLALKATEGLHDVYFVFKNDKAKAIQPLLSLSSVRFMNVLNL
ncbi:PQQ-dependent sugar dehydrogenase [Spirosoma utsteinense]|uniref:Cytochrome c n=1 Tax=Spirosoma utsteinense TaxID=2585773 RepID=A0ABR6WC89_9BACT|nr:PQQ-dependent sugar dehydrogenase [Spirosoma utsteinense]MBC3788236.1 cytochrome c [Spirosoma utsteinense]MBC3794197.1 cytochrome c [Spirosoma utsteinense]